MSFQRTIRVDGASADAGMFPMVLATEGEASDGHILSIAGGKIPKQMPLLSAHMNHPTETLGSVIQPRKETRTEPKALHALGVVELGGEGASADMRRDLYHMIEQGHIGAVSVRWDADPGDAIRRVNLPSDHPHFVDEEKEPSGSPRRYGMFFRKWRAMEGSVVPIGADPSALIGRADELEREGASAERVAFCRALAAEAEVPEPVEDAEPQPEEERAADAPPEEAAPVVEPEEAEPIGDPVDPDFDEAADRLRDLLSQGISCDTVIAFARELKESEPSTEQQLAEAFERISVLQSALDGAREKGREEGEPPPPIHRTEEMFDYLEKRFEDANERALAMVQATINAQRGKPMEGRTPYERLQNEAQSLIAEMRRQRQEQDSGSLDLSALVTEFESRLDRARERVVGSLGPRS